MTKKTPEQKRYEEAGYWFVWGGLTAVGKCFIIGIILLFVVQALLAMVRPIDDSDVSHFQRSGVRIITDAKTGRQYLATPEGGIVPREERAR